MADPIQSLIRGQAARVVPALAFALWAAVAALGMHAEWSYAATPGVPGSAQPQWPRRSRLQAPQQRPSLLLFAHPQCPCTRATLAELRGLLAQAPAVDATVIFVRPPGADDAWMQGGLRDAAARIAGVRVVVDADGAEARRFAARTSGQVLVYSAGGALIFSGGITALRGHSGDNSGRESALAALRGDAPASSTHPVFGCALLDADEAAP